jgi:hypothetical protein
MDRVRVREISVEDLHQLKLWQESNPDAPEGKWFKDFGSFKLCGEGRRLEGQVNPHTSNTFSTSSP